MGELGTHLAIERASVGNSPPKVIRAALLPDGVPGRLPGESGGEGPVTLLKGLWRAERFGEAFDFVFTQEAMKYLHPIAKSIF
jgi:hypothetical protein